MQPRLYWQIQRLAFLLEKRADDALKEQLGIGFAQYKVLEAINQHSLARQNTIAELLDQTEASISRQIRLLQARDIVRVGTVMGNKRARELTLSMQGEELVSQAVEVLDVAMAQVVGGVSYQEQRLIQELFDRMLERARKPQLL